MINYTVHRHAVGLTKIQKKGFKFKNVHYLALYEKFFNNFIIILAILFYVSSTDYSKLIPLFSPYFIFITILVVALFVLH